MFILKCIKCGCDRKIKNKKNVNLTIKLNRLHCRSCALKIKYNDPILKNKISTISKEKLNSPDMRKKISDKTKEKLSNVEIRKKISEANKKRFENSDQRKIQQLNGIKRWSNLNARKEQSYKIKKAWLDPEIRKKYIDTNKNNHWCNVKCDKNQLHLINKWNRLGFNFKANVKIICGTNIYYLDGYDKIKNVVLEIDSKYHKKPSQKEKDLIRQQNIINTINPNCFWRFDDVYKKYKVVYRKI